MTFSESVTKLLLADLKPSGKYVMQDLHEIGGTPAVMKMLLEAGRLHGDCMTVTGKTIAENLKDVPSLSIDQDIIRPWSNPIKPTGHLQILYGNLAEGGAVAKITGKEGELFEGPAHVFDSEQDLNQAIIDQKIKAGEVIVIRYCGPKGYWHAGNAQTNECIDGCRIGRQSGTDHGWQI